VYTHVQGGPATALSPEITRARLILIRSWRDGDRAPIKSPPGLTRSTYRAYLLSICRLIGDKREEGRLGEEEEEGSWRI
jgi:hypothetical protein